MMQFAFNAVELCVVTINEIPWTCTREVPMTLGIWQGHQDSRCCKTTL